MPKFITIDKRDVSVGGREDFSKKDYSTEKNKVKTARKKANEDNLAFMLFKGWITKDEYIASVEIRWLILRRDFMEARRDTITRLGQATCDFKGHTDGIDGKLEIIEDIFKYFEGWNKRLIHLKECLAKQLLKDKIAEAIIIYGKMPADVKNNKDYRTNINHFKNILSDYMRE